MSYEMHTSVKYCLLYVFLRWYFFAFKMNIISIRRCIVDTDVVNDVMCMRQNVITRVVIQFL